MQPLADGIVAPNTPVRVFRLGRVVKASAAATTFSSVNSLSSGPLWSVSVFAIDPARSWLDGIYNLLSLLLIVLGNSVVFLNPSSLKTAVSALLAIRLHGAISATQHAR